MSESHTFSKAPRLLSGLSLTPWPPVSSKEYTEISQGNLCPSHTHTVKLGQLLYLYTGMSLGFPGNVVCAHTRAFSMSEVGCCQEEGLRLPRNILEGHLAARGWSHDWAWVPWSTGRPALSLRLESICQYRISGRACFRHLRLWNKPPPNTVAENKAHFWLLTESMGQESRRGTAGRVYRSLSMCGASVGMSRRLCW